MVEEGSTISLRYKEIKGEIIKIVKIKEIFD
jgi:hypothetical protein